MKRYVRLILMPLVVSAAIIVPLMGRGADTPHQDKKENAGEDKNKNEGEAGKGNAATDDMNNAPPGEEKKEGPKVSVNGSIETTGNVYNSYNRYYHRLKTEYRAYENVAFDAAFGENWFFRFNSRVAYQTQKGGSEGNWLYNFYYGYLDFTTDKIEVQLGRIMDFNNLVYLYFDGLNIEGKIPVGDNRLTLDCYGGFIVKDDYLEEYRNPWVLRTFSSTDYRNLFIKQRKGDYVAGLKADFLAKNAVLFGAEYQIIFNGGDLSEHYVSLNFETMFSKIIRLYGYGTLDLVEKLPSNTLAALQINPAQFLSIVLQHEYYRPVFIKDSYFRAYFEPYGNQEASATLIFFILKPLTLDLKYGAIIYNSDKDPGHEVSLSLEHRDIYRFGLRLNADLITGPEGSLVTLQGTIKRRVFVFDFLVGGGVQFYDESTIKKGMSKGYFATLGSDIRIIKSLILSITGEYSSNEDYDYNIRGNLSLKYLFSR